MSDINITFITSCPRSGSSLVGWMFKESGAFGGIVQPREDFGFSENRQIKKRCVSPYIHRFFQGRANPRQKRKSINPHRAPVPFKNRVDFYHPPYFRALVLEIFRREGWDESQPLFFKMPLMCLMAPVFHEAFPEAKWVVVRREKQDVIRSLMEKRWIKRPEKRPADDEVLEDPTVDMYFRALDAIEAQPDLDSSTVDYDALMTGDLSEIKTALTRSDLVFDEEHLRELILPPHHPERF